VNGEVLGRLLAALHQAGPGSPNNLPHNITANVPDDDAVDSISGVADVQVGAPSVDLIDGSDTRFVLDVPIRARWRNSGVDRIPEYVHGRVRGEYDISTLRVDPASVSFAGTAEDPMTMQGPHRAADPNAHAKVVAVARRVLDRIEPCGVIPQEFGRLRSLVRSGESAILLPLPVNFGNLDLPVGDLANVDSIALDGHDFCAVVSIGTMLPALQAQLDMHAPKVDGVDEVRIGRPTLTWEPGGVLTVKVDGDILITVAGVLTTGADINIRQDIAFKIYGNVLQLEAQPVGVRVQPRGEILSNAFAEEVRNQIVQRLPPEVQKIVNAIQPHLPQPGLIASTIEAGLRQFLGDVDAFLTNHAFTADGLILRGDVRFAERTRPRASIVRLDDDLLIDASGSWIPGGWIERFDWSWMPAPIVTSVEIGEASRVDRFVLDDPPRIVIGGPPPVPGLGRGTGYVFVTVHGVHVDPRTGGLEPVEATKCLAFGFPPPQIFGGLVSGDPRLTHGVLVQGPKRKDGTPYEIGVMAGRRDRRHNILVVHAGPQWTVDLSQTLSDALGRMDRSDAGLQVSILLPKGSIEELGAAIAEPFSGVVDELGIPVVIDEDAEGRWAAMLGADERPVWRIYAPGGAVAWTAAGSLDGEELGAALRGCLFRSPPALAAALVDVDRLPPLFPDGSDDTRVPVTFVTVGHASSEAELARLKKAGGEHIVVADGIGSEQATELQTSLGDGFSVIGDPDGSLTDEIGIATWPVTIERDPDGTAHTWRIADYDFEQEIAR
jgi:hypothetical protein